MADTTDILSLPFPDLDGSDTADVPRDINALAVAIEELLVEGGPLWGPGDIKFSAQSADHGRWLLLDGRELTQAQVESALGLDSGGAADLVTLLGTGSSSKYGDAASGKIKLPDMRDRMPIAKGSSHPLKDTGSSGGAETVTLTAGQSGIRSHSHGVTDGGHSHGVTDPGHTHGASSGSTTPTITVNSGTTGVTAATDSKAPTISASSDNKAPTITITDPGHHHGPQGSGFGFFGPNSGGPNKVNQSTGTNAQTNTTTSDEVTGITAKQDAHSHTITASQESHSHAVTVTDPGHTHTLSQSAHSHSVTVSSTTTGVSVNSATTGISVDWLSSAPASDAHENMPPYRAIGSAFMRV